MIAESLRFAGKLKGLHENELDMKVKRRYSATLSNCFGMMNSQCSDITRCAQNVVNALNVTALAQPKPNVFRCGFHAHSGRRDLTVLPFVADLLRRSPAPICCC